MILSYLDYEDWHHAIHHELVEELLSRKLAWKKKLGEASVKAAAEPPSMDFDWNVDIRKPTAFVNCSRKVHESRKRLEHQWTVWDDARIDRELATQRFFLGASFRAFARSIRIGTISSTLEFDKTESDRAFRECFGTMDNEPSYVYAIPGITPIKVKSDYEAGQAFSLYLGRKGYVAADPRTFEAKTMEFIADVTNPPPPLSPHDTRRRSAMVNFIRKLAVVMFRTKKPPTRTMPNSGKACLELPRSKGGKREALYCGTIDDTHRFHTTPVSILTAGKVRPITIGSLFQERYSWLNRYMFNRLRNLPCMIAGMEVTDWAKAMVPAELPEGHVFISSDFQKATTLFNGCFAEAVIDELGKIVGLTSAEVDEILSGLTRANFGRREIVDGESTWVELGKQLRGQNLGADASFPILCMVTITIAMETLGEIDRYNAMSIKAFAESIADESRFGVNGDDLMIMGPRSLCDRWVAATRATGGVAEKSKSPVNPTYWTANSTLFRGNQLVPFVSAGLLFNLAERPKAPQAYWIKSLQYPMLNGPKLGIAHLVLGDVPRKYGGLGEEPRGDRLWQIRYRFAMIGVPKSEASWLEEEVPMGLVHRGKGKTVLTRLLESHPSVKVTGLIKKTDLTLYAADVYQLRNILEWSAAKTKFKSFREKLAILDKRYLVSVLPDLERARFENWIFDNGYVYVKDRPFVRPILARVRVAGHSVEELLNGVTDSPG
jgi:hypothetical protein